MAVSNPLEFALRKTKIICTVGPASSSEETLAQMMLAGMNVARLNFSHGTHESHAEHIRRIRSVAQRLGIPIAILQDLQGPRIRIGRFGNGGSVLLETGQRFTLTTQTVVGTQDVVSTSYGDLPRTVGVGDFVLLDDGKLELQVASVSADEVVTTVHRGGRLASNKGINLPGVVVDIPVLTDKDRADIAFGLEQDVDYVAVSFVQKASDLQYVRRVLRTASADGTTVPVIAKLEKPVAIDNLDAILDESDGVMVARGDLGVEMSPQKVPSAQKYIIERANECGKIVITATQMLESMVSNARPTRAESSDVANAIFDGTDAVMLSAETAAGKYPVEAVRVMSEIAVEAERHEHEWGRFKEIDDPTSVNAVALARAARELANNLSVAAIAIFTRTGSTARLVSKERPHVPILAFTPIPETYPRMALHWGVSPHLVQRATSVEEMIRYVENALRDIAHL
ncbi:MAG: pyruvate kinase, partial [Anaerolineales bacterium]